MSIDRVTRATVEEFLFREAWLLDDWKLTEWLGLFTVDARYLVPSTDLPPDADPATSLYVVNDDYRQLCFRVKRMLHPQGHAEQPHSVTQRLISNVVIGPIADETLDVQAAFHVSRSRHEKTDVFVGRYLHRLVLKDGELRFVQRKARLAMPSLRPVGTLSIIL